MTSSRPDVLVPEWAFEDRLRKIRRLLKLEQREMAERLGIGRQAYSSYEAGRAKPRDLVALARRIELLTGVPASWVLGLDDAPAAAAATAPAASRPNAEKSSFYSKPGQRVAPPMGAGPTAEGAQGCNVRRKAA